MNQTTKQIPKLLALMALAGLMMVSTSTPIVQADDARADEAVRRAGVKLKDKNPDVRAEGVEDCAKANNEKGAEAILGCLQNEDDGPAGWRMSTAISTMSSIEAMKVFEDELLDWDGKPDRLLPMFWGFFGLARGNTEGGTTVLRKAITESDEDDYYIRAAALEAIGRAGRKDLGDVFVKAASEIEDKKAFDKGLILTFSLISAAPGAVGPEDKDIRNKLVLELADLLELVQEEEPEEQDRIEYFLTRSLSAITGEKPYLQPEAWRFWVKMGGEKVDGQDEGATAAGRHPPIFFGGGAIGNRIVFVIDVSGSMMHPADLPPDMRKPPKKEPEEEKRGPISGESKKEKSDREKKEAEKRKRIPPPDYSKVKSKMDLAKVELAHAIKHLHEDFFFNVVIYDTDHHLLLSSTKSLVKATESNKKKFIKKVNGLQPLALTNIHGALKRAFCIHMKGSIDYKKKDPAWDPNCIQSGATTIFFLTDGSPTISDDTTNRGEVGTPGGPPVGNGRMCNPQMIYEDIMKFNVFRKCVIHTVGIGPHDGRLLDALSRSTGGVYKDLSGGPQPR